MIIIIGFWELIHSTIDNMSTVWFLFILHTHQKVYEIKFFIKKN